MNRLFRLFGGLILVASLVIGWIGYSAWTFLQRPLPLDKEIHINVVPGSSLQEIAQSLQQQGILTEPFYWVAWARWRGQADKIKAGEYALQPGLTARQLLDKLVEGKTLLYRVTIVEGMTFAQLRQQLQQHPQIKTTLAGKSNTEVMQILGLAGLHPEGQFLPETYAFPANTTDVEFLKRAHSALRDYLQKAWQGRDQQATAVLKNPEEALILASIVEKETGLASERNLIAGVFLARLNKGMRLQTDPTVIYGLGERFDGNLRRKDLRSDTPYNTYTRFGLPPTPICLPSAAAIDAVMHPQATKALFFVSKGDGSHHFSETLAEHNRAVIRYQLGGRNKPFSSNPAKPAEP